MLDTAFNDKKLKKELFSLLKQLSPNDFLLTVDEVSKRLGVGHVTVRELIKDEEIFAMKLNGYKISNSELNRFIAENKNRDFGKILS
ncbi:helix-turn-helix domain-containing protein [Metaclostridioides mangenotii]|uniref:helix-turn-helix domain-containing protein n=1 Tax=Metaclostridioides mangenotii TaxID=1540 RepID=UPI0004660D6E|nr:helix-turn-helix domain-containing protein [Clostridioides mangenotii]